MVDMFPHTITLFNVIKKDNKTIYLRKIIREVFYISEKIISTEGSGEKYTNTHRVIFSSNALKDYINSQSYKFDEDKYTLNNNDIIVKGEISQIENQNDLKNYDYFLIKTISDNSDYGSEYLRNVEVTD